MEAACIAASLLYFSPAKTIIELAVVGYPGSVHRGPWPGMGRLRAAKHACEIHGSWPVCPRVRLPSNERGMLVDRLGKGVQKEEENRDSQLRCAKSRLGGHA